MKQFSSIIEKSNEVLGGTPVFCGTRVPIQAFLDYLESGQRLDDFLEDFPTVSRDMALNCLELMKDLVISQAHENIAR